MLYKTPVPDTESDALSESAVLTTNYYLGEDKKEEDEKDEDTVMSKQALGTHTVTFKCIGATKDMEAQRALQRTSEQLRAGQQVPVDVFLEPLNQYDSRAITSKFMLLISGPQLDMWSEKLWYII